jgi:hypothetical protein
MPLTPFSFNSSLPPPPLFGQILPMPTLALKPTQKVATDYFENLAGFASLGINRTPTPSCPQKGWAK